MRVGGRDTQPRRRSISPSVSHTLDSSLIKGSLFAASQPSDPRKAREPHHACVENPTWFYIINSHNRKLNYPCETDGFVVSLKIEYVWKYENISCIMHWI